MAYETGITVIPFAGKSSIPALESVLAALPYSAKILSPSSWMNIRHAQSDGEIAVFIFDRNIQKNRVCKQFEDLGDIPKIAMFTQNGVLEHRWLLDRCSEVSHWPCGAEELNYRFHRMLGNRLVRKPPTPVDRALRKEFVTMNLIGESEEFMQSLTLIRQVAKHDASVLLLGETGTGKELAARAIHYMGARSSQPFIPVNCGGLPDNIFENELFGHEQGAYTDARKSHTGLVGQAQGGTLFLDEVDTLSQKSQIVLLRFLQDHQYKPLGAQRYQQANLRIIAATNASLDELVSRGAFRQDLLFRLNIMQIVMPPLRNRSDDMVLLSAHFIQRFMAQYGGPERTIDRGSLAWMRGYLWPGNVRELENTLHRAFLVSDSPVLHLHPAQSASQGTEPVDIRGVDWDTEFNEARDLVITKFEKRYLQHVLRKVGGNVSKAAKLAGKERRTLGRLIKKHGLNNRKPPFS